MVPWREASRPKMDQSHLSTSKTHRPPTLEVRKAILETPAETDDRDSTSEPCRQIFTSHSLMCHVSSMAVTASSKRRRSSTVQRRPATAAWELGKSCRRRDWQSPAEHAVGSSRSPIFRANLGRPPLCPGPPMAPGATDISGGPRVETLSTLGPWNPGPGQERFCNLQKIKNTAPPAGSGGS